jgi:hypothetical protein
LEENVMHDQEKLDLRKIGEKLAGEVELRVPKLWLAIGAVGVFALLLVALD